MPRLCKPWTTGEERRAVELRRAGLTIPAVARRLGRSRLSVACKLQQLREVVPAKRRPTGALQKAIRRYAGKLPDWEIGYILGVSREAVTCSRNRAGIPPFDPKQSARRKSQTGTTDQGHPAESSASSCAASAASASVG